MLSRPIFRPTSDPCRCPVPGILQGDLALQGIFGAEEEKKVVEAQVKAKVKGKQLEKDTLNQFLIIVRIGRA